MGSIVDRLRKRKEDRKVVGVHFEDSEGHEAYPELAEFLYRAKVGKDYRKPGSFRLFVDGGVLKCCFTAPSEGQVGFVTVSSLVDLLDTLNGLLAEDKVDWREDTWRKGSGRS